jgi:gluconate 2-dehydrogenase gamma chain
MAGTVPRREFIGLVAGSIIPIAIAEAGTDATVTPSTVTPSAPASAEVRRAHVFMALNQAQAAFIVAAVDTIIPGDELSPSGSECGVAEFIDRQLAGRWGAGGGSYRSGPFLAGSPEYGEQQILTPLEYFRAGIGATNDWSRGNFGSEFDQLTPAVREEALATLQRGVPEFAAFDLSQFFSQLLRLTREGFFADPIYGGNRNKVAWQMIGYPGLPSLYARHMNSAMYEAPVKMSPRSIEDFS